MMLCVSIVSLPSWKNVNGSSSSFFLFSVDFSCQEAHYLVKERKYFLAPGDCSASQKAESDFCSPTTQRRSQCPGKWENWC